MAVRDKSVEPYCRMVQKAVPDFDVSKDYVLWIVSDFWSNSCLYDISGCVMLYDDQNQVIDLSSRFHKFKFVVRTPYTNRKVRQIGIQSGRKRVFGVPIVIHDALMFADIKKIKIHWDVIHPMYSNDSAVFCLRLVSLDVVYKTSFDLCPDKHWFTLCHEDSRFDWELFDHQYFDHVSQYYDCMISSFDNTVTSDGPLHSDYIVDCGDSEIHSIDGKVRPLTEKDRLVLSELDALPFDDLIAMARSCEKKYDVKVTGEWAADRYYYEKQIELISRGVPDIAALSTWGFK